MQRSTERILTTHTGSLPRPTDVLEALRARENGDLFDRSAFELRLGDAVAENVRRQAQVGIDVVNDGEVGKPSFQAYVMERLSGFEAKPLPDGAQPATGPIDPNGKIGRAHV